MELNEGFIDTSNSLSSWEQDTTGFFQPSDYETIALELEALEPELCSAEWSSDDECSNLSTIKLETFEVPATPPDQILHIQSAESFAEPTCQPDQELALTLYQKRRGTGGVWQPVAQNERIRVDKSKGKLVRLYAKSPKANIGEEGWTFQIYLVDKARPEMSIQQGDGFTIEPARPAKGGIDVTGKEFKLKLTKISRNQYFLVTAKRGNIQLTGCTLEFRSDDNGKVLNSKKRARSEISGTSNGLLACRDICADNDLVNLIARSLVPVILDNFQAQLASGNLEDSIAKRIRLAFNPAAIKCEAVNC